MADVKQPLVAMHHDLNRQTKMSLAGA